MIFGRLLEKPKTFPINLSFLVKLGSNNKPTAIFLINNENENE